MSEYCDNWCWFHNRCEYSKHVYRICGECFHVYRTRFHLWWANVKAWHHFRRPSRLYSCPYCIHDW